MNPMTEPNTPIKDERLVDALMMLQYEFPLHSPHPYSDVAERAGMKEELLLNELKKLSSIGVLKRVGFYINYRAERKKAALIALQVKDPLLSTKLLASLLEVTHSYIRDHDIYNLWVVGKHQDPSTIVESVKLAARKLDVKRWIVLWGVRTYRLSVKFDLYKGVSRAGPFSKITQDPPSLSELGLDKSLVISLRRLPLEPRPYSVIGRRYGMGEDEVHELVLELFKKGILADPGAALDGHKLGFTYNGMFTLAPRNDVSLSTLCEWISENIEEATHVVERDSTPKGAWRHLCYFMFHAVSEKLKTVVEDKLRACSLIDDYMVLKSIRDMLPGVLR